MAAPDRNCERQRITVIIEYPSFAFNNLRYVIRKKKKKNPIQCFAVNIISVNSNRDVQIIFPENP